MRISSESHAPTSTAAKDRKKYCRPITLWSVLKIWRRRKDRLGSALRVVEEGMASVAYCGRLLRLDPFFELWFAHHPHHRAHAIVPKATQLGTGNFIHADFRRREVR